MFTYKQDEYISWGLNKHAITNKDLSQIGWKKMELWIKN